MQTATVGDVQKNFSKVLKSLRAGEEIVITRRGKAVAKLTAPGPRKEIDWPDFYAEAIETGGKSVSEIVLDAREDRF